MLRRYHRRGAGYWGGLRDCSQTWLISNGGVSEPTQLQVTASTAAISTIANNSTMMRNRQICEKIPAAMHGLLAANLLFLFDGYTPTYMHVWS